MFCTNCGKEVADGASFCTACGAKIVRENAAQPINEQQAVTSAPSPAATPSPNAQQPAAAAAPVSASGTPKNTNVKIIIAIAAVAVVVILALLLFGRGGGYKDYKELARAYYQAVYNEDVDAMIKLFDKEAQKDLKQDKDYIKERLEEMKQDMNDWYGRGWNKHVEPGKRERASERGTYKVEIEIDGDFHEYLYIKKDDKDRYYIHEDYTDF